ncbi:MAG: aminopeptidase P family N-terminal domain-containing protein, partial [Oscillospiraceae bacterium]
MINQRIEALQEILKQKKLAAIIIPTQDFHMSEYVGEYFKARRYFSGFTGSAGVMVITQNQANLWTDGRYFIQAPKELAGSCVVLQKMGEEGVPTVKEYLKKTLKSGDVLCFDGRVISTKECREYEEELGQQGVTLYTKEDLVGLVWHDRPALSCEPAFILGEKYAGETVVDKLAKVRKIMAEKGADVHILGSLDDIAWLFNIRGNDVANTPVVLSYGAITMDNAIIFANSNAFSSEMKEELEKSGVTLKEYDEIYSYAQSIAKEKKVMLDIARTNCA